MSEEIARAVDSVLARVESAARRAGRDPNEVTLLAATKSVDPEDIASAVRAGIRVVGENIVREMVEKQEAVSSILGPDAVRWHFIGTLQRNKAGKVAGLVEVIHSVDSVALAEAIGRRAGSSPQAVLLEINTSGEESKHGFAPEHVRDSLERITGIDGVVVKGAMTMAPPRDPDAARVAFSQLAAYVAEPWWPEGAVELSMGMSDDFEVAVEEGATIIRVGSAIFGARCDLGLGA